MADIPNRGPELMTVCIIMLTLSVITFSLRTYTRLALVKTWGLEDWCMSLAAISFVLFITSALTGVHYGTGRHFTDLTAENIRQAMKYWWFCYIWYCITMIFSKISIGVFLLRLTVTRVHHAIIYVVMLLTVASGIVFFFVTLFQCHPVTYFWDKETKGGTCIDPKIIAALTYLYSSFSVICDFTFSILPMFLISGLQMGRRAKWALVPILGIGCVASIAVAVRFAYIHNFLDPDFLWATVDIAIWSSNEQGLAITAASLATLRPLVRIWGEKLGMLTTGMRSSMPLTNDAYANTANMDKFKESRAMKPTGDDISLENFMYGGNDEGTADCRSNGRNIKQGDHDRNIYATTTIEVSSDSDNDATTVVGSRDNRQWGQARGHRNRSESEHKLKM
ncbi:hypothetical protein F5Y07DRAFT_362937 [Xylaria sp. FL0933]|nr:hypothetical protein F5Y07DRAFT_362937 [Xylaria sp. FL0933]